MTTRAAKLLLALVALAVAVTSCGGSGVEAPPLGETRTACIDDFCADYPDGWVVAELGGRFISFTHPASPDVIATVGRVNLEGIVVNAGGTWPVPPREVVDRLWSLLDGGEAELGDVRLEAGGVYDSWGFISSGRMWHRLVPVSASRGYGIEVRAPNETWEPHADVFRRGVEVLNEDL